jgi:hypothetical protein
MAEDDRKLAIMHNWKYIAKGWVESLTSYFVVPKGDHHVRMVFDMTKSKLNACLWALGFGLPTVDSLANEVDELSWLEILMLVKCFLIFPYTHPSSLIAEWIFNPSSLRRWWVGRP